jgi:hypothetical protein
MACCIHTDNRPNCTRESEEFEEFCEDSAVCSLKSAIKNTSHNCNIFNLFNFSKANGKAGNKMLFAIAEIAANLPTTICMGW